MEIDVGCIEGSGYLASSVDLLSIRIEAGFVAGSGTISATATPATFVHNENFDVTIDLSDGGDYGPLLDWYFDHGNWPSGSGYITGIYPHGGSIGDLANKIIGAGLLSFNLARSVVISATSIFGESYITGTFAKTYSKLNTVAWSGIGNFNIIPSSDNITAGHAVLPWSGDVWQVKKLGNRMMVYGENGISKFHPVSEPHSGYGQNVLFNFGLAGRYAVAGNELVHYFVGEDNNLYRIQPENTPDKLGYAEYFEKFSGNMVGMFDQLSGRAFFSSVETETTLVYNPELGLTSLDLLITDLVRYEDTLTVIAPSAANNTLPLVTHECVSHIEDFGQRGLKTITGLSFGIDFDEATNVWAVVYYRYRKNDSFRKFPNVRLNHEGYVHIGVTAIEFMIGLRFVRDSAVLEPTFLDYVQAHVQYGDRRYRRGPIASGGATNVY
jgi:hypothetical protein